MIFFLYIKPSPDLYLVSYPDPNVRNDEANKSIEVVLVLALQSESRVRVTSR